MYLIAGQIHKLQISLVSEGVIRQGHKLIVAQVKLKQLCEALEHLWTDLAEVVV